MMNSIFKTSLTIFLLLILFTSCAPLQFSKEKSTSIKELSINWDYSESVDSIYQPTVDSVLNNIIESFNREKHSFKLHKKQEGEADGLTIHFSRGKFTSDGEITASYIVSVLGIIVSPLIIYSATDGHGLLFFWYFAADGMMVKANLSPELAGDNKKKVKQYIRTGATFSNPTARMDRMCTQINDYIREILTNLDASTKN